MTAHRPAALAATLLLLAGTTACSLLAVPADRIPKESGSGVRPPKQVLMSAAQRLDDVGGARIETVEEGPAGRRSAAGTLRWGAQDTAELTLTDERGTARLTGRDGSFELVYEGGATAPRRAERTGVESLDARGPDSPGDYRGGWPTALVSNPGGPAHAMGLTGKLTPLGGEQLAGTTVAHYRGEAPVAAYFGADQGLVGARLAAVLDHYRQRGVTTVAYDFWVAPGDRLLRLRETVRGSAGTVVRTTDVSDAGNAPQSPAAEPPPSTTAPAPEAGTPGASGEPTAAP
ncbi:hypothetical protein ACWGB8_11510 [Kitasatospora sp. NPDC054939]